MGLPEHIYSVLVVSASNKFNDSLRRLLPEDRYSPVILAADVSDARRKLLEERYDLVIVNTPLPDDFGTRLALDVCASSGTGVLLLVGAEHYPDVNARVSPYGVLVLSKPTTGTVVDSNRFNAANANAVTMTTDGDKDTAAEVWGALDWDPARYVGVEYTLKSAVDCGDAYVYAQSGEKWRVYAS